VQAGDFSQWRTSAVKQLFSDDPHQYWLCQLAGKIGGSGLEPQSWKVNTRDSPGAPRSPSAGIGFLLDHEGQRLRAAAQVLASPDGKRR